MQVSLFQPKNTAWLQVLAELILDRPAFFKPVLKTTLLNVILDGRRIAKEQGLQIFSFID